jgi:hypothetical protein
LCYATRDGVAERFVRTIRSKCLDWLLIAETRQLEGVLSVFSDHCNRHRAHRSLNLTPPAGWSLVTAHTNTRDLTVVRRDRLGGVLHEYWRAAGATPRLCTPQPFAVLCIALCHLVPVLDNGHARESSSQELSRLIKCGALRLDSDSDEGLLASICRAFATSSDERGAQRPAVCGLSAHSPCARRRLTFLV